MKKFKLFYFLIILNLNFNFSIINFKNKFIKNNKILKFISNNPKKTTFLLFLCNSYLSYNYFSKNIININNNEDKKFLKIMILFINLNVFIISKFFSYSTKKIPAYFNKTKFKKLIKLNFIVDFNYFLFYNICYQNIYRDTNYVLFLFFILNKSYQFSKNIKNKILFSEFFINLSIKKVKLKKISNDKNINEIESEMTDNLEAGGLFNNQIKIDEDPKNKNFYLNKNKLIENLKNLFKSQEVNIDINNTKIEFKQNQNMIVFTNNDNIKINKDFINNLEKNCFDVNLYQNIFTNCIYSSKKNIIKSNFLKIDKPDLGLSIPFITMYFT